MKNLEEARQEALAKGRRREVADRILAAVGWTLGFALIVGLVTLTGFRCQSLGGDRQGQLVFGNWDGSPEAYRFDLEAGTSLQARLTVPGLPTPSAEFRLVGDKGSVSAGGVLAVATRWENLSETRTKLVGPRHLSVLLPKGFGAMHATVRPIFRGEEWRVDYRTEP